VSTQTRTVVAYVAPCIAWGSTYLAIRIGVGHLPPALFAGVRLVSAGSLLLLLTVAHGLLVWTVVGSLIGFSSFVYVLHNVRATVAGTYAYVNTVIAGLLGWVVLGEPLSVGSVLAMSIVVGAVIWVRLATQAPARVTHRRPSRPTPAPAAGDA
jgi:drug/metabolite transporter (DMT)-like permease